MPKKREKRRVLTERETQMKQICELAAQQRVQRMQRDTICLRWHRRRRGIPDPPHEPHIVFVRGNPSDPLTIEPVNDQVVVTVPNEMYRTFLRQMYLITILAILFTCIPTMCLCVTKTNVSKALYLPYYVWLLGAVILVIFAATCPPMRRISPANWIFAALIVIMLTLVAAYRCRFSEWILLAIGITLSSILVVGLLVLGVCVPTKYLPGGTISTLFLAAVGISFVISVFITILTTSPTPVVVCASLALALVTGILLIHAQYVHGRRIIIPFMTMPFCALTIYISFIMIIVCLDVFYFFIYHRTPPEKWLTV